VPEPTITARRLRSASLVGVLVLVYSALLIVTYRVQIVPSYEEVGFLLHTPTPAEWMIMFELAVAPGLMLRPECERPSDALTWALYVLGYVPLCFVPMLASDGYGIDRQRILGLIAICGLAMTLIIAGRSWMRRLPSVRLGRFDRSTSIAVLVIVSALTYGLSLVYVRGFTIVGFDEVMDIRDQLTEGARAGGPLLSYLVLTQSHSINPMVMALGVEQSRWRVALLGAIGQLFFYAAGGLRAVMMSPFLLCGAWVAMRNGGRRLGYYILGGVIVMLALFLVLAPPATDDGRAWIIVRAMVWRTLIIPPHTVGIYFDVFSHLPVTHFGHVKGFSLFFHNPYDEPIPFIVARWFYGKPFSMNGGLFAEGFAGWGAIGILISAGVATVAFAVLDAVTRDLSRRFVVMAISFHAINLTNLSIFTLLLGSGLGASLLMLGLLSRRLAASSSAAPALRIIEPASA
jgi:hypothetical protein